LFIIFSSSIFEIATVHVMPRVGAEQTFKTAKPYNQLSWILNDENYDPALFDASSTLVRSLKAYPLWPFSQNRNTRLEIYLDPTVVDYMQQKELFMFSADNIQKQRKHMGVFIAVHAFMFGLALSK
jgi:hypothetical protein